MSWLMLIMKKQPAVSIASGLLLSILFVLPLWGYRAFYLSENIEFYRDEIIDIRYFLYIGFACCVGFVIGAQLINGHWAKNALAMIVNSVLLPFIVILLIEDPFLAPEHAVLFFLPMLLVLLLLGAQLLGLATMGVIKLFRRFVMAS